MHMKSVKRWVPLILLGLGMIVALKSGLHEKVSLQELQENREALLSTVSSRPVLSALGFIGVYILFVALSLPAATLLTLTGGFLFGSWLGTLYVVTGATIGATLVFLIARSSLGTALRNKAGGIYKKVEGNMNQNAIEYLLFMRLVPVFPFFLVNIVPALFNVGLRTYVVTTFLGILPASFVFVNLGTQLAEIDSLSDLVSMPTLIAFSLLGVIALIPTLYRQMKGKRKLLLGMVLPISLFHAPLAHGLDEYPSFLSMYDGLLESHVSQATRNVIVFNGVDYDAWSKDPRHGDAFSILTKLDPNNLAGKEKMAFWMNTYNFLTIHLIIENQERESILNLGSLFSNPWKKHSWRIGGESISLHDIEHRILRKLGDARIHFAINCASVSCPDLRRESYKVASLDQQLEDQVRKTLANQGKGLRMDKGTLHLSKIFDWYRQDFQNKDIRGWIREYVPVDTDADIKFMEYDWSLNLRN